MSIVVTAITLIVCSTKSGRKPDEATRYSYNLDGQLTRITRPDGAVVDFGYDAGGRLSGIATPSESVGYGYDASGRLADVTNGKERLSWSYDGSLLLESVWSGTVSGVVGRTYDNNFNVAFLGVNRTETVGFTYDADGLLSSSGAISFTRDPQNGLITGSVIGTLSDVYGYNGFGEIVSRESSATGSPLYGEAFSRDSLGRITRKVESVNGVQVVYDYGYDTSGRLVEVIRDGIPASGYSYDSNGNRVSATVEGVTENGAYDAQDRMISYGGASYAYTANGELMTKTEGGQTTSYDYDVFGNLRGVALPDGALIEYVIDGGNRRVGKKVDGVLVRGFLYRDQLNPIAELDGAGNVVSLFVYGSRMNVPDYMVRGGVTYRMGSPRMVVNTADGTIIQRMEYDEFGNITFDTNPGFQPFGFAGGLYDRDTGFIRFGARDYDPRTGRWTSKDPIRFAGGDTNLFGYVLGDAVNLVDMDGLYWEYSQSSGEVAHVDEQTGERTFVGEGYSGNGEGFNNPGMQDIRDVGPIPQGTYTIGPPRHGGRLGPQVMDLIPDPSNNMHERDLFRIHGDNPSKNKTASSGCIILAPEFRQKISGSSDPELKVVR